MTTAAASNQVDALISEAGALLVKTKWFAAERAADKALRDARQAGDRQRMINAIAPLMEARGKRLEVAWQDATINLVTKPLGEDPDITPGCHLVQPPRVGADARRLRLLALEREMPVFIVCREPATQLGMVPIVAIGPGMTMRTQVDPPDDHDAPDLDWMCYAHQELGDAAIDQIDPELEQGKRIDMLLAMIDALPEHANLHLALQEACKVIDSSGG